MWMFDITTTQLFYLLIFVLFCSLSPLCTLNVLTGKKNRRKVVECHCVCVLNDASTAELYERLKTKRKRIEIKTARRDPVNWTTKYNVVNCNEFIVLYADFNLLFVPLVTVCAVNFSVVACFARFSFFFSQYKSHYQRSIPRK